MLNNKNHVSINLYEKDSQYKPVPKKSSLSFDLKYIIVGNLLFFLIVGGFAAMLLLISSDKSGVAPNHTLILISIDGFRYSYLEFENTHPNINELIKNGVKSEIIPVFPSKTFPNHYSIITGLYSESHGIVSNKFFNPETNRTFSHSNSTESLKSDWWLGEPFWNVVNKAGKKTASYFWPGSEAEINGMRPTYYLRFDDSTPNEVRVNKVIEWLTMDADKRPSFITLYFSDVDTQGHLFGPDSDEVKNAIKRVDNAIGILTKKVKELKERDIDIIIVSDHGMTPVEDYIYIDDYIDVDKYNIPEISSPTAHASIWADESEIPIIIEKLKDVQNATIYKKEDLPLRFHYNSSIRIAPLHVVPDSGFLITKRTLPSSEYFKYGDHGYDPLSGNMTGIFIANGKSFYSGVTTKPFENVEIFNIMAGVMKIRPPPNNGTLPYIDGIIKDK